MGDALEYLRDGILAHCFLTKHILLSSRSLQVDTSHASTLLSAIVLLLHHQVKLVQPITACAVFLFVITLWFQQANHRHATLMLQLFHQSSIINYQSSITQYTP